MLVNTHVHSNDDWLMRWGLVKIHNHYTITWKRIGNSTRDQSKSVRRVNQSIKLCRIFIWWWLALCRYNRPWRVKVFTSNKGSLNQQEKIYICSFGLHPSLPHLTWVCLRVLLGIEMITRQVIESQKEQLVSFPPLCRIKGYELEVKNTWPAVT